MCAAMRCATRFVHLLLTVSCWTCVIGRVTARELTSIWTMNFRYLKMALIIFRWFILICVQYNELCSLYFFSDAQNQITKFISHISRLHWQRVLGVLVTSLKRFAYFEHNCVVVLTRAVNCSVELLSQVNRCKCDGNNERKTFDNSFSINYQAANIKWIERSTLQCSVRMREVIERKKNILTTENTSPHLTCFQRQLTTLSLHFRTKYSNLFLCVIANWVI